MRSLLPALALTALAACSESPRSPDLAMLYRGAHGDGTDRSPLVTVPGILGSRLVDTDTGQVIWGAGNRGLSADPEDPDALRLLALPIGDGTRPISDLRDDVRPDGILDVANIEVLGVPIMVDIYKGATGLLGAGGFVVEKAATGPGGGAPDDGGGPVGFHRAPGAPPPAPKAPVDMGDPNAFVFAYDWRRDIIESAHGLGRFLQNRRQRIAAERGVPPEEVRFDILAHSMGGLVTRYFLMYGFAEPGPDGALPPITWAGAEYVDRVVFIAPPNAGSITALDNLVNGKTLGPFQPFYPAAMLATHPSVYELLPRSRHGRLRRHGKPWGDLFDIGLWEDEHWGLLSPAAEANLATLLPDVDPAERHRRARAYMAQLLARAQVFQAMMDRWAPPPDRLEMFLVVGSGFETPSWGEVDDDGNFEIKGVEEGDGVVLRASALLDERLDGDTSTGLRSPLRFKTTLFLPDEHTQLVRNPVFGDNLLFWLLDEPRAAEALRKPRRSKLYAGSAPSAGDRSPAPVFTPGNEQ